MALQTEQWLLLLLRPFPKWPPEYAIFYGKTEGKIKKKYANFKAYQKMIGVYAAQESAWMDEGMMQL